MQREIRLVALLIMVLIGSGQAAWAGSQEGVEGKEKAKEKESLPTFKEADKNGDGRLSLEEAKALGISKETFDEEDLDGDGSLTKYDYKYGVK